jgi:YVTN family beta-propeller protein
VFTAEGDRSIAGYDPSSNRIAWRFPTAQDTTHMVTASRDGRTLFTSNIGSNTITILERAGETWRPTHVPVGAGPEGLALSPDERELWTAHTGDGAVSIIDVGGKKVIASVAARTRRSNRVKFTRDGRYALISDLDGGEIVVVDARTRAVVRRVPLGSMPEGILIPPEGDRVYIAVTGENRVVAIDVRTLNVVQTISAGRGPDGMAWAVPRTTTDPERALK